MFDLIAGFELAILAVLLGTILLLFYYRRGRQRQGQLAEAVFVVVVAIGAIFAPQLAAVLLLAGIYQQLVLMNRSRNQ